MKADHDLDTAVTVGSLAMIREQYSIPIEYGLHVSRDADRMDLDELRGMPKVSCGKAPSTRTAAPAREVITSPARETPKASSKRSSDASTEQVDDLARRPKKVKVLTRRHKSRQGEGETRNRSNGKEPAALSEELETPVEFDEGGALSVHHRSRSMKDLFKTKFIRTMQAAEEFERGLLHPQLAQELYTLPSEVLLARATKEMVLMALFDRVHDAGRLITFMDYHISNLQQELDALKSGGGLEAIAKAKERAFELEQELGKTKQERDEALQRLEASEKELTKALESARSELPKQAVDRYKESVGFKEGLKRMGRATYEYGYRVALARFRALHPDSEVEEDPFTIHPEDDLVLMKRQQAFDDSDPPES
ncbi:hypothetical protein BHM03_00018412 [Ensete ventricosum]|nr:hypothetical protein BHM03_00018412 [Ensete ventricosum]